MKTVPRLKRFVLKRVIPGIGAIRRGIGRPPLRMGMSMTHRTPRDELAGLLARLHPRRAEAPMIRLGPAGDGGYLVPDDLEGIGACFSPGVGRISGFESDCVARGMRVFMADASVPGPAEANPSFDFLGKYLGATCSDTTITLDRWVERALGDQRGDLMLQMDIERSEYVTLLSASTAVMERFRVLVIEFHGLDDLIWWPYFNVASSAFDKLLETHACVHIHPNNVRPPTRVLGLSLPPMAEFTFLRRDRQITDDFVTDFPHPLDADNTPKVHVRLPSALHR